MDILLEEKEIQNSEVTLVEWFVMFRTEIQCGFDFFIIFFK